MNHYIALGVAPAPDCTIGRRPAYSHEQRKKVIAFFEHKAKLLDIKEASKWLGIHYNTLARLVDAGLIPPPSHKLVRRLHYHQDELANLKAAIDKLEPPKVPKVWDTLEAKGYYSAVRAAEKLGIPEVTLASWIKKKKIPKPNRSVEGRLVYDTQDLNHIKSIKAAYFKRKKIAP